MAEILQLLSAVRAWVCTGSPQLGALGLFLGSGTGRLGGILTTTQVNHGRHVDPWLRAGAAIGLVAGLLLGGEVQPPAWVWAPAVLFGGWAMTRVGNDKRLRRMLGRVAVPGPRAAGFVLAPAAGLVLTVQYLSLNLSTTYATQLGLGPTSVAALFGAAPVIGTFGVYPPGGKWVSRRRLVAVSTAAIAVAEIITVWLPAAAGLVVQLCATSLAFVPWAILGRFTDPEEAIPEEFRTWGEHVTGRWWGIAYGVMTVILVGVGELLHGPASEQAMALGRFQQWWGLALLVAAGLAAWLLPDEEVRWGEGNPWREFLGDAIGKPKAGTLALLAVYGGGTVSSQDGYLPIAMHHVGFDTTQVSWTSVSVVIGVAVFFLPKRFRHERWVPRCGVAIAASGAVCWLASLMSPAAGPGWVGFLLARCGIEGTTSWLTAYTQRSDISAFVQLAKGLGQLSALFLDAALESTVGWAGICGVIVTLGVAVVLTSVRRRERKLRATRLSGWRFSFFRPS